METSASLLERLRTAPDEAAWERLDAIYRPLIRRWRLRDPRLGEEADDLVQDVMHVLVRELPGFHRQRNGSFRRWLRTITVHRVLAHHRARRSRPQALGAPPEEEPMFEPATLAAFRRVVFDEIGAAQVAGELGLSLNAVLLAKSRVLSKLREEAEGLID